MLFSLHPRPKIMPFSEVYSLQSLAMVALISSKSIGE